MRSIVPRLSTPAARPRGRPFSIESRDEQIEGHAMGGVAETGHGNRHLVKASLLDRMGDTAREQLWNLLGVMEEAFLEGDTATVLAGFQVINQELRPQIERLDLAEDEEFRHEAPQHVGRARRECRDIIGLVTGRQLAPVVA